MTAFLLRLIVGFIGQTGYLGVALLMAAESACLPLPSEIILPFAGFLVAEGRMNLFAVATVGALGCNLGSLFAYEVGRLGGRPLLERWGRYVLVGPREMDRAERFFARFGDAAVLIARLLPGVRTYVALPAGIAEMRRLPFHVYTFVGSWPWCLALTWAGVLIGDAWRRDPGLHQALRYADWAVATAALAALAAFLWRRLRRRAAGAK
ncbi:MAG TPA: DedA family protein [Caulobacteraceae bacterium]|nr:DedA family protein [Caulobacteraceae bacterium]